MDFLMNTCVGVLIRIASVLSRDLETQISRFQFLGSAGDFPPSEEIRFRCVSGGRNQLGK
jgi:hypothetical protein